MTREELCGIITKTKKEVITMAVTKKCAGQIHAALKSGKSNAEIAKKVGVQPKTVADFRSKKKTARTTIRKG